MPVVMIGAVGVGVVARHKKGTYDPEYGACEPKAGCVNAAIFAYSPRF